MIHRRCLGFYWRTPLLLPVALGLAPVTMVATEAHAAVQQEQVVERVGNRLLRAIGQRGDAIGVPGWPPEFRVGEEECLACSYMETGQPVVYIHPWILEVLVGANEDLLALILGHELGHHVLGHLAAQPSFDRSKIEQTAESQEQELAADRWGVELLASTDYSARHALWGLLNWFWIHEEYEQAFGDPSPYDALASTHPSWAQRGAFANLILGDKEQAALWTTIGVYQDAVTFLRLEQYEYAAAGFEAVLRSYDDVPEAWANLGYARLMDYCDLLEPDDVDTFGFELSHLVADGFYSRARSLEAKVRRRAIRADVWRQAVIALQKALELEPRLTLARANLGLAYLVGPDGRRDVWEATRLLREANRLAATDPLLSGPARAAVAVNLAAAELATGDDQRFLSLVAEVMQDSAADLDSGDNLALLYDYAVLLSRSEAKDDQIRAASLFHSYLGRASRASLWWALAYRRYATLVRAAGTEPEPEAAFARSNALRPVVGVDVAPGRTVRLGQPTREVLALLGDTESNRIVRGTDLVRYRWPHRGLEIFGAAGRVLLIRLTGSLPLDLRQAGLGSPNGEGGNVLRVGMSAADLEATLRSKGQVSFLLPYTNAGALHRYFPRVGVAVRLVSGRVTEIVIVQVESESK